MDRVIVYPGSIPLDTDLLNTNRNAMIAIGALAQATLGANTIVDGLAVSPTTPASLAVVCGPGSITALSTVDQNAYGSLAADTTETLVKVGVNLDPTSFTLTAPTTSGQAINYLLEASFVESDANPVVLPYYNAANPSVPYLGPANNGVAQATTRIQRVQLQLKAGLAATIGSQSTPSVDSGWSGLAVITVAYGQTQITAVNIATSFASPLLQYKLPQLRPGFSQIQSFTSSSTFTLPIGVSRVRVTVIGGGGAGGTAANIPGGGGGAGGTALRIIAGLSPGASIPITVGAGGNAVTSGVGTGGNGGTSSFGTYASATGGLGGMGGAVGLAAGGGGGSAVGGDVNTVGSCGTDSVIPAAKGGDGGGPGAGRGATGSSQGIAGFGYGGGGGGGGATNTSGTGTGYPGGNGGPGLVIVEY